MDIINEIFSGEINKTIADRIFNSLDSVFDPSYWFLKELNINLYDNQIEILNAVTNLNEKYVAIIGGRSSGKTFAVAGGIVFLCIIYPKLQVGVFGPKAAQAIRILDEINFRVLNDKIKNTYLEMERCNKTYLLFKNKSSILAQSAAQETEGEGYHFDILVCDESQRISDFSFSQRLAPMISSSSIGKIIQLGVPLYKGHFWRAFQEGSQYTKIIHDWKKCPKYHLGGSIKINNQLYPRTIIEQMPKSLKIKNFPDNPELWFESTTNMSEEDFITQYEMGWLNNLSLVLTEDDQIKLSSGSFEPLEVGHPYEEYYFGLDFAGGVAIGNKEKSDFTAISVIRKTPDNRKEVVFSHEWKGDLSTQVGEIIYLIHPQKGRFKCKFGLADYGNMGSGLVDIMIKEGIPIRGLYFHSKDPKSGKNFKNAMIDHLIFELRNDRFFYPYSAIHNMTPRNDVYKLLKKHFEEWCSLERHISSSGINHDIKSPDELHDDGCFSNALAVFAADNMLTDGLAVGYQLPGVKRCNGLFKSNIFNSGGKTWIRKIF